MDKKYIPEKLRLGTAGHVLYHDFILKQDLTFAEVARRMGTHTSTVSDLIDNCRNITDAMAEKLVLAFPETTTDFWKGHKPNKLRHHKGKTKANLYW